MNNRMSPRASGQSIQDNFKQKLNELKQQTAQMIKPADQQSQSTMKTENEAELKLKDVETLNVPEDGLG